MRFGARELVSPWKHACEATRVVDQHRQVLRADPVNTVEIGQLEQRCLARATLTRQTSLVVGWARHHTSLTATLVASLTYLRSAARGVELLSQHNPTGISQDRQIGQDLLGLQIGPRERRYPAADLLHRAYAVDEVEYLLGLVGP